MSPLILENKSIHKSEKGYEPKAVFTIHGRMSEFKPVSAIINDTRVIQAQSEKKGSKNVFP